MSSHEQGWAHTCAIWRVGRRAAVWAGQGVHRRGAEARPAAKALHIRIHSRCEVPAIWCCAGSTLLLRLLLGTEPLKQPPCVLKALPPRIQRRVAATCRLHRPCRLQRRRRCCRVQACTGSCLINHIDGRIRQAAVWDIPLCRPHRCTRGEGAGTAAAVGDGHVRGGRQRQPLALSYPCTACSHAQELGMRSQPHHTARACGQGGVCEAHAMVPLVPLAQPLQPRHRLLGRRLVHHHRLQQVRGGEGHGRQRWAGSAGTTAMALCGVRTSV